MTESHFLFSLLKDDRELRQALGRVLQETLRDLPKQGLPLTAVERSFVVIDLLYGNQVLDLEALAALCWAVNLGPKEISQLSREVELKKKARELTGLEPGELGTDESGRLFVWVADLGRVFE